MARVILHIGTHKTGSTSFQDLMAHNAPALAKAGIYYPRIGRPAGHHGIVGDWNPALPDMYRWADGSAATLRRLARDHAGNDGVLILSSEELSRGEPGRAPDLTAIHEMLSTFERVDVLCVLREQWQFVQSVWMEVARERAPWPPTWLANGAMMNDTADGLWVDYNRLYDRLLESFPADRIRFVDFDVARRAPGGLVPTLLHEMGLRDLPPLAEVHGGRSNVSPPPLPAWIATGLEQPAGPGLVALMEGAFRTRFGAARSCLFSREEMAKLKLHFGRRNARLHERIAKVQPGFAITASDPAADTVFRDDLDADLWLECLRAVRQASRS